MNPESSRPRGSSVVPPRRRRTIITALSAGTVLACLSLQLWLSFTTPSSPFANDSTVLDWRVAVASCHQSVPPRTVYLLDHTDAAKKGATTTTTATALYYGSTDSSSDMFEGLAGPCPYCQQDSDAYIWPFEQPFYQQCTLMAAWQITVFPTCNLLHEIPLLQDSSVSLLSRQGSWRDVWSLQDGHQQQAVLKLPKMEREFGHQAHQYSRVDAMAMERLTASPYVVDIFGFCGLSVVSQWAPTSSYSLIRKSRLGSPARLEIARDLARALSAVHSIDYPDGTNATLSHNDINGVNVVVGVNGKVKLNDFNLGTLMRWNGTGSNSSSSSSQRPCGMPVRFLVKERKSPEENRNESYVDPAMTDVYALGNLLYLIMTSRDPWTTLEQPSNSSNNNGSALSPDDVKRKKLLGQVPFVPIKFQQSHKITLQALHHATMACYQQEPSQRLTARQLAVALDAALGFVQRKVNVTREQVQQLFEKRDKPR